MFPHESSVFLGKGNDLREQFQCTENTKYGPIMSDARWVNLCKYKQRDRMRIVHSGSFMYKVG